MTKKQKQRENLITLCKGITEFNETKFCMDYYANDEAFIGLEPMHLADLNPCGTSCCLAGHGPFLGIPAKNGEGWDEYCYRQFGTRAGSDHWLFLFSSCWSNGREQAQARLYHYLTESDEANGWDEQVDKFRMEFTLPTKEQLEALN